MMTATAPPAVECQILQFKQLFKLKTRHDVSKKTYQKPTNLVAISAVHGLTFVGEQNALKAIVTLKLFDETRNFSPKTLQNYLHRDIILPASPTHIDINPEQKLLAVAFIHNEVPILRIYVIDSFFAQDITYFSEIRLSSTEGTFITDLSWNPGIPNVLACCISDGSLSTYSINNNDSFEMKSLPKESSSVCVCWSPKGKQIVVGNSDGYLTQYLPELKAVRNIPPPTDLFPKTCTLCSVKWISNFQFIGVYKTPEQCLTDDEDIKSCVVVVNAPKNGPVQYVNYDDVCFSGGTDRPVQFYFSHISAWNLIFVSSSNSLEVAVLSLGQDNQTWIVWNLEPEESRITLPFLKSGEAFPVGVTIDYSVPIQTSIDDKLISMPALYVMTCEGLLCIYLINFFNSAASNVCTPVSRSYSLQYFSSESIYGGEATHEQSHLQTSSNLQNASELAHNLVQATPQLRETITLVDASLQTGHEQLQISDLNLLNKRNSVFNFETAIAKEMVPELLNKTMQPSVPYNRIVPSDQLLTLKSSVPNSTCSPSNSREAIGVTKQTEPSRLLLEMVKKLKKRASVFENDIQEIKYLVSNINVCCNKTSSRMLEEFTSLNKNAGKLKVINLDLRNEIDLLRISIIEVFSCVQDIKSKLFQFMNPGYQSLAGIQDIDPISLKNMKSIHSTINYLQTQVEKANKQLEDMWFQFLQNPTVPTTKVPILENVYETMVKQQKILGFLKLHTENLGNCFTGIVRRLNGKNFLKQNTYLQVNLPWSKDKLLNENLPLDELTRKTLNMNALLDDQPDPKQLAVKYSYEHAKRFHLSFAKQAKLQELLSTNNINHIQSNRLQRLKKKSLIVLSKKLHKWDANNVAERYVEKMTENVDRDSMISPVALDELKMIPTNSELVSSTPLKCKESSHNLLDNALPGKPSPFISSTTNNIAKHNCPISPRIIQTIQKQDKLELSPQDLVSEVQESTITTTQQSKISAVPSPVAISVPVSASSSSSGTPMFGMKCEIGTASIFSNSSLQLSFTPAKMELKTTLAQPMPAISSENSVTHLTESATGAPTFQDLLHSSCGSNSDLVLASKSTTTSGFFNDSNSNSSTSSPMFSFALPKNEASHTVKISSPVANLTMSSIFSGKSLPTMGPKTEFSSIGALPNVAVPNSVTSGQTLIKTFSSDISKFEPFSENSSSAPTISNAVSVETMASESISASVACTMISNAPIAIKSSLPVFENTPVLGDKLTPTANNVINSLNFGSMLSNSLFAEKKNEKQTGITVPVSTASKESAFSSFSFVSKPLLNVTDSLTIAEVTNNDKKNTNEEIININNSQKELFSFATPLSFSPTSTSITAVDSGTVTNSIISVTTAAVPTFASSATTPITVASIIYSMPMTSAVTITAIETSPTNSNETDAFNKSSFFGSLKLGTAVSVATDRTNTSTVSIFGKVPPASVSSISSLFSNGTGVSAFPQTANVTAADTVSSQSELLFGSGNTSQLFGQGVAPSSSTKNKNLFSGVTSADNFQNTDSVFSSGGSIFGGSANFGTRSPTQTRTFGSTSGASVFGSNLSTSFSNTSSGFSSPSFFSGNVQQQQPTGACGFGSPPTFSSVFNKTGSGFPAFGSAPTFGGSPAFGTSPSKVFGQTPVNMGTFGTVPVSQHPNEFESLTNENTLSFGNLAQQQQPSGFGSAPSFCNTNTQSTFGSSSNFGSSSFSSWR